MSDKRKFEFAQAQAVATLLVEELRPVCERIEVAGSLRRCAPKVGDIEIVYIPKFRQGLVDGELFVGEIDLAMAQIYWLEQVGVLQRRPNINGVETFGEQNKLMRHVSSGIPVDLFATDARSWSNYLVCRTGPAAFNIRVASRARELGWQWHPYDAGFSRIRPGSNVREWRFIGSEEDLFEFCGWSYIQPWERANTEENGGRGRASNAQPAAQSIITSQGGATGRSTVSGGILGSPIKASP